MVVGWHYHPIPVLCWLCDGQQLGDIMSFCKSRWAKHGAPTLPFDDSRLEAPTLPFPSLLKFRQVSFPPEQLCWYRFGICCLRREAGRSAWWFPFLESCSRWNAIFKHEVKVDRMRGLALFCHVRSDQNGFSHSFKRFCFFVGCFHWRSSRPRSAWAIHCILGTFLFVPPS